MGSPAYESPLLPEVTVWRESTTMPDYEVLASHCDPFPQCPKVARGTLGRVVIVGKTITDPEALAALGVGHGEGAVEITEALYRAGHESL